MTTLYYRALFFVCPIILLYTIRGTDSIDCYVCSTSNIITADNAGYSNAACLPNEKPTVCSDSVFFICVNVQGGCQSCTIESEITTFELVSDKPTTFSSYTRNCSNQSFSIDNNSNNITETDCSVLVDNQFEQKSNCSYSCTTNLCNNGNVVPATTPTPTTTNASANACGIQSFISTITSLLVAVILVALICDFLSFGIKWCMIKLIMIRFTRVYDFCRL